MSLINLQAERRGFIALIATIVISLILSAAVLSQSQNSFFVRSEVLNRELQKTSEYLAYGCVQKAIQHLSDDYLYIPITTGEKVSIGVDSCIILSVVHGLEDASHKKIVEVKVQAERGGSYSNIVVQVETVNPSLSHFEEPKVISYIEVPSFP